MEEFFDILKEVELFERMEEKDIVSMLSCMNAKVIRVKKDEIVLMEGSTIKHIGIILGGRLHIEKSDMDGERTLIASLSTGDFFGEALCCAGVTESPVSAVADMDSAVMRIEFRRILHTCPNTCLFHTQLIENMLRIMARKNLMLQNRMDFISKRTLRAKILTYLKSFHVKLGCEFTIPFNREELANFLCVDRSALSHELSRMKKDGIIEYQRSSFKLL